MWVKSTSNHPNAVPVCGECYEAVQWDIKTCALTLRVLQTYLTARNIHGSELQTSGFLGGEKRQVSEPRVKRGRWREAVVHLAVLAWRCSCPVILDTLTRDSQEGSTWCGRWLLGAICGSVLGSFLLQKHPESLLSRHVSWPHSSSI